MCFHESKWVRFEDTKIVGWYNLTWVWSALLPLTVTELLFDERLEKESPSLLKLWLYHCLTAIYPLKRSHK
jgi:hypothetical protein